MIQMPPLLGYEALSWTTVAITIVYVLFKLVRSRQKTFNYFKEIGIPGPEPSLIWGNLAEYHKKGFVHAITDWCAKYGDIFGFYNGDLPMLVVKDLDFLTYVFIKEFKNFTDRGTLGVNLAIYEPLQCLAMDYTGRVVFGLDCCFQRNPSHPFMQAARDVIHGVMTGPFHMIAHCTSTLADIVAPILWLNEKFGSFSFSIFGEETKKVVEMRLRNPEARRPDLLQIMLDASEKEERPNGADWKSKATMTLQEVELNTTVSVFAGFTTRRAINDFEYNGVKYKAGTSIMAPTMHIHMDHRYWPEPHKFDPERFVAGNAASRASIAYQPFGVGPRNCVGERLALLEIMYTVARMLQKYRLTLGESQKVIAMIRTWSMLSYETVSLTTLAIVVVYVLFRLVRSRQKTFNYFKEIGIPGPEPSLIWGNFVEYHKKGFVHAISEWCAKYGDVFGFYNGDLPMLVVKDLDFLTYAFVTEFKNFTDRGILMRTNQEHAVLSKSIMNAKGAQWRRARSCISQAFTSNKLKQAMQDIVESADLFIETLGDFADAGRELAIYEPLQGLAMDYTGRAAFGLDCCFQRNLSHPFMQAALQVVQGVMTGPFHMIAHCTSTLANIVSPIFWLNEKFGSFSYGIFGEETKKVVEMRLRNPEARRPDLLQIMLDATEKTEWPDDADCKGKATMTLQEVELNTTVTVIAGFETTSTAMAYVSYVLAKYQDVQEKVRAGSRLSSRGICFSRKMQASWASVAYQPFGLGPRNCVGERLAILEIMYTVARMVQVYRLTLGESQKKDLELHFYASLSAPQCGPYIKFQRI
ncbi:hypothetical protein MTO96_015159 [Rhipicephalus appendiculatus]